MTTLLLVVVGLVAIALLLVARRRAAAAVGGASNPAALPPAAAPPRAPVRSEAPPPALAPARAPTADPPVGEAVVLPGWPIPGEPGFFELGPSGHETSAPDESLTEPLPAPQPDSPSLEVDGGPAFDPAVGWSGLDDEEAGAPAPASPPPAPAGERVDWEIDPAAFDPAIGWTDPSAADRDGAS